MKIWIFRLCAAILVPLLMLMLGEGALRLYIHFKYGVPGKSYGLWRYDSVLGAQHMENGYNTRGQTNNRGFRNREDMIEPRPEGAFRRLAYGGSTTFCYNLADEQTWPSRLEHVLRSRHHPHDQVLNGGAILWSIGHAYARAKKEMQDIKPDFVILYTGINEEGNAHALARQGVLMSEKTRAGEFGKFATNFPQNRWAQRHLVLMRLLEYLVLPRLRGAGRAPDVPVADTDGTDAAQPDPDILANYLHVLGEFINLIRNAGAQPVFVIQAHAGQETWTGRLAGYSRAGAQVAAGMGAMLVDAQEMVDDYDGPPTDLFADTGVHFSSRGAAMLGEFIADAILDAEK